jgi:hypothetical protein
MTDEPRRASGGQDTQHLASMEPRDVDPAKTARVRGLYGRVLTEDEVRAVAMIETEFDDEVRPWQVYPGIGPEPFFYARRRRTVMNALVARDIAGIYQEIKDWMVEHEGDGWD